MIFSADVLDSSLYPCSLWIVYKQSRINPAFARETFLRSVCKWGLSSSFRWDTTNNAIASSTNIHQTSRAGCMIASVVRGFKNIVRWQYNKRPWVTRDLHVRCGKSVSHWWFRSWKFAIRHRRSNICMSKLHDSLLSHELTASWCRDQKEMSFYFISTTYFLLIFPKSIQINNIHILHCHPPSFSLFFKSRGTLIFLSFSRFSFFFLAWNGIERE